MINLFARTCLKIKLVSFFINTTVSWAGDGGEDDRRQPKQAVVGHFPSFCTMLSILMLLVSIQEREAKKIQRIKDLEQERVREAPRD